MTRTAIVVAAPPPHERFYRVSCFGKADRLGPEWILAILAEGVPDIPVGARVTVEYQTHANTIAPWRITEVIEGS